MVLLRDEFWALISSNERHQLLLIFSVSSDSRFGSLFTNPLVPDVQYNILIFQQDGAPLQLAVAVQNYSNETFTKQ